MRRSSAFDMPFFLGVIYLVLFGIIFVYSSSYPQAIERNNDQGYHFALNQIYFAVLGFIGLFILMRTRAEWLEKYALIWWALAIALMAAVYIVGRAHHGHKTFFDLPGGFTLQPSEFVKPALVVALASYLARRPGAVYTWERILKGPLILLLLTLIIILLEQDVGTALVVGLGTLLLLGVAGAPGRIWVVAVVIFLVCGLGYVMTGNTGEGGRKDRILAWMDPFNCPLPAADQPRAGLIAIGSGGLFGLGVGQSVMKWGWLPGAHNDYIFAIILEELGFIWTFALLLLPYLFVIYRGFAVGQRAPDNFTMILAMGCTVMIATQALVNMMMNTNLLPCTGVNLPFISSGGSSIIGTLAMCGLILNVTMPRTTVGHARRGAPDDEGRARRGGPPDERPRP